MCWRRDGSKKRVPLDRQMRRTFDLSLFSCCARTDVATSVTRHWEVAAELEQWEGNLHQSHTGKSPPIPHRENYTHKARWGFPWIILFSERRDCNYPTTFLLPPSTPTLHPLPSSQSSECTRHEKNVKQEGKIMFKIKVFVLFFSLAVC